MPRKGYIAKREVAPDPVYNSTLVTKFVNSMMWGGKKSTAQGIFYTAMTNLETKGGDEALKLFKKAIENCKPLLEVKSAVSAEPTIRFPSKFCPSGVPRLPFAGWSPMAAHVAKRAWSRS